METVECSYQNAILFNHWQYYASDYFGFCEERRAGRALIHTILYFLFFLVMFLLFLYHHSLYFCGLIWNVGHIRRNGGKRESW